MQVHINSGRFTGFPSAPPFVAKRLKLLKFVGDCLNSLNRYPFFDGAFCQQPHFPLRERDENMSKLELKQQKEGRGFLPVIQDWVSTSSIG